MNYFLKSSFLQSYHVPDTVFTHGKISLSTGILNSSSFEQGIGSTSNRRELSRSPPSGLPRTQSSSYPLLLLHCFFFVLNISYQLTNMLLSHCASIMPLQNVLFLRAVLFFLVIPVPSLMPLSCFSLVVAAFDPIIRA